MSMPLEGIKVLELTHRLYGPRAGVHLAEMGAEVIKIESPQGGDPVRLVTGGELPEREGISYWFELENHGKKSIALDLRVKEGQEVGQRLAKWADVFITNFQVYALQKLRMDYDILSKMNPRLIYALGTGWGMEGPEKDRPAYDYVIYAASGLMDVMGQPGQPPSSCRPGMGDHIAACMLDYAIMLGLWHREKTGEGQLVHVSLLAAFIEAGAGALTAHLLTGKEIERIDRSAAPNCLWNYYCAKENRWVQFAMPDADRYWADFCRIFGIEHLEKDPRFDTLEHRGKNAREIIAILDKVIASKTMDEWEARLRGGTVIWGWVNKYSELGKNPQLVPNGLVETVVHPTLGPIKEVGVTINLSKTPGKITGPGPELGQHTEEVLLEMGYSWDDIIKLKDKKAIG